MLRKEWSLALLATIGSVSTARTAAAAEPPPDPAAVLFSERCSTCHNIGGGPKVGPDLLGVVTRRAKSWFAKFVRGPARLIDGADPIAAELYKKFGPVKMPDQPLSDAEVDAVWAYFASCNDKGGCLPVAVGGRWGTDATEEEVARGRDIFSGSRRLQRGGAPCFACHNVRDLAWMGGGTLGPDLTFAYARLGEKGIGPLLSEMSMAAAAAATEQKDRVPPPAATYALMHSVYAATPLEEEEQTDVKAYLASLARDGTTSRKDRDFLPLGLEGAGIVLGALVLRNRRRGSAS